MAVYTVHQPPLKKYEAAPDPERFAFVRDGFSFWAFLLGAAVDAAAPDVAGAARLHRGRRRHAGRLAPGRRVERRLLRSRRSCWRCWSAWRRERCGASRSAGGGWRNVGTIVGSDRETVERRFFDSWVQGRNARRRCRRQCRDAAAPAAPAQRGATPAPDVIGLFPAARGASVTVAIVDYGSGNLHSAAKAFERAARESGRRRSRSWSPAVPRRCARADRIVLPGVGAFADCRRGLDAVDRHDRGARTSACASAAGRSSASASACS